MKTLVVPDIHEQTIDHLYPLMDEADHVILLGDWFDTFNEHRVAEMCHQIKEMFRRGYTMLLGNHDCHYLFDHPSFMCSGYTPSTKETVKRELMDYREGWKLYTEVDGITISHAGFNDATIVYKDPAVAAAAIDVGLAGEFDPIFGAGRARGGWQRWGGPTWLDWNYEFSPVDGRPQIVGHTVGKSVRVEEDSKGLKSYCLDTGLKHIAWIEDGTVRIQEYS